jgi:opacity protein-like surface antigen
MRKINKIKLIAVFLGLASVTAETWATGSGFYMGLQAGYANLNNEPQTINTGLKAINPNKFCNPNIPGDCLLVPNVSPSNQGIAGRFFMGANFNEYMALEVGVTGYTPSEYSPDVDVNPHETPHKPHIWEYTGDVLGKVMYPFGPFSVFAKGGLGVVYWSPTSAIVFSEDEKNSGDWFAVPAYGFGAAYDFTPNWQVDFTWMKFQGTERLQSIDFVALGISYHFVQEYCGQFLC